MTAARPGRVLALSGGIGGAKLALGLSRVLPAEDLVVVANTGDDFRHLGLAISPDIDTLLYTLSGLADPVKGWGRRGETWSFMAALAGLGGETWFQLGDGDLALHVERTRRLAAGETLSEVVEAIRLRLGIGPKILPVTDDPVPTRIRTQDGWLDFQEYFVRLRCEPAVLGFAFSGAEVAQPQAEILPLLRDPGLRAVVICPSNPFISVDPILAVPGIRAAIAACAAPVVAVSPIIGGQAVKGPTAKMMRELDLPVGAAAVARHYDGLVDIFVSDQGDGAVALPPGMAGRQAKTLMTDLADRENLARVVLDAADAWSRSPHDPRGSPRGRSPRPTEHQ